MFVIALILGVIGLIALTAAIFVKDPDSRAMTGFFGGGAVVVAVIVIVLSCLTVVGTRNYGVVTNFGAPTGRVLDNGIAFKAPWQKVTDIDGTITTQKFVGTERNEKTGSLGCIGVRISDGSTACVSTVIRTRVDRAHADDVFTDYRSSDKEVNDAVNDALVRTQLTSALASVFADFNPLLVPGSAEAAEKDTQSAPDLQSFGGSVKDKMRTLLEAASKDGRAQVDVVSVTLSYIRLSDSTQDRLNQLQAEVAQTRIAKQKKETASEQAAANNELAASLAKNPNVLVAQCLDTLAELVAKGHEPNAAAFQCWPGAGSSVVLPATK